ncbi:MAG: sigma-70 family RNA polymerase sigma factor [bacterium]|nr:sigma-70 family RNA polymerase sigma factor [bacterium]
MQSRPMAPAATFDNEQTGGLIVSATPQNTAEQQDRKRMLLELIEDVAEGNKSAFARLYGLTHGKLLGVALRILRDRALAEDVLQETYIKIWHHAASYDPKIAAPMTWMATIIRHGAIDALRKRQTEAFAPEEEIPALASNDPDPVEEMHLARLRPKALAAFAKLPEDKRRLIMLAYLRDRSRHELSARLGIPANTIKTHLRRALMEVRATMLASIEPRAHGAA